MIVLRMLLYLICITSIGWSVLVFGGPPIIKRLIYEYSEGALTPSGITVSPRLDVRINRLEFKFQNEIAGPYIEGFSRAVEIAWSIFSEKPFLEINIGPSVFKDYATADSVNLYTPAIQEIDWQNIAIVADLDLVTLNSFVKTNSITFDANVNFQTAKLSNVNIVAEGFVLTDGLSNYSAALIRRELSDLNLKANLTEQLYSSIFEIKDIMVSEPKLTAQEAIMEISVKEKARNFKIDLHDARLLDFGGQMQDLKADGSFTEHNGLQELQIVFVDGFFPKKLPKFQELSAMVKRLGHEQYQISIEGNLEEFELSDSDNFIGLLPEGNFVIESEIDRAIPKMTSTTKFKFTTLRSTEIFGFLDLGFTSEILRNLECPFWDCELNDLNLLYRINIDDEWVKGSAYCLKSLCDLSEIEYLVRTSNTPNIFTILNQENILSPLYSLYLFSALSSGQKINGGHELKFQF